MHKKTFLYSFTILILCSLSWYQGYGQLRFPENGFSIGFYNVENLFDTIDNPSTRDEDFLPGSKIEWNTAKYTFKLKNIARVIAAMDTNGFPNFLGMSEVENRLVLEDLVARPELETAGYAILHVEDTDPRGIEVAAIYRKNYFQPISVQTFRPETIVKEQRHILYVKGRIATGDTLHLFVNHWSSRFGGVEKTAAARNRLAAALRQKVDSLFLENANAHIVIMGDFNDNPTDESITTYLGAGAANEAFEPKQLYNLALEPYMNGEGSYFYRQWDMFDQIMVSPSLIQAKKLKASGQQVVKYEWMLFYPRQSTARPNRSASGTKYFGGFSDHLPVMIRLFKN